MEILLKSLKLFCFGIYADLYRKIFENELEKQFLSGNGISNSYLTAMSNKNYRIQKKLQKLETNLRNVIYARSFN